MSPSDTRALNALNDQLCALAEKAPSHQLMLMALIGVYQAIAVTHPCCTHSAALTALVVGRDLQSKSQNAPSGVPLH